MQKKESDLPYVKAMPINNEEDGHFLDEIREAVKEVNLIKKGKLKGRPVADIDFRY